MLEKVNILQKFGLFQETWSPKIVAELNESYVKLVRLKGEFIWHHHDTEDELFLVIQGRLTIQTPEDEIVLDEGEMMVIPNGMEHRPVAVEEALVLLLEPKATRNTGNIENERSVESQWI